jgi:hypothetical protein
MKQFIYPFFLLTAFLSHVCNAQTQPCFKSPVFYQGGGRAITTADFNGDGKPDIVSVVTQSGINILMNTGSGSFSSPVLYNLHVAVCLEALAADFNGDGKPDLAVGCCTDGSFSLASEGIMILLNTGNGTFSSPVFYKGSLAVSLNSADFNGDGKLDIAMTGDIASILINKGNGIFDAPVFYNNKTGYFISVNSGDFNGDGKPDMAILNSGGDSQKVSIYINNGSGIPNTPINIGIGNIPLYSTTGCLTSGDFNGDGKTDLAVALDNKIKILINTGSGNFKITGVLNAGNLRGLISVDVNGDNKPDLVGAFPVVFLNDGSGNFSSGVSYGQSTLAEIVSADFNGDGKLDLATSAIRIYLSCPNSTPPTANYNNLPTSLCLGGNINVSPSVTGTMPKLAALVDNSISVNAPKKITKNSQAVFVLEGNDQVKRFDLNGSLQYTYNPGGSMISGIRTIAADENNNVFADNGNGRLYKLGAAGDSSSFESFGLSNTTTSMGFIPYDYSPGNLFVADTNGNYFTNIDTSSTNPFINWGFQDVTSMDNGHLITSFSYDNNFYAEKRLLLADIATNKLWSRKLYDASGNGNADPRLLVDGNLTKNLAFDFIDADTVHNIICVSSSTTKALGIITPVNSTDGSQEASLDTLLTSSVHAQQPVGMISATATNIPQFWIADKGQNKLLRAKIIVYQVIPNLPAGLTFDPVSGTIKGTPTAVASPQTYKVIVSDGINSDTTSLTIGVSPTGPLNNSPGTSTAGTVHTDGLTVKYFSSNNCDKLIQIADSIGGTSPGATTIKQDLLPTLSVLASDSLIRRVTHIDAQNPQASATVVLYYTYEDIQLYNTSRGKTILSNDTVNGVMQVAVLQMHDSTNGRKYPIMHNPVTAKWSTADHNWVVSFPVTKFSDFYAGDTSSIRSFSCANKSADTITVTANYYIWNYDTLFASGDYKDTIVNITGCDSVASLHLTLKSSGITTPLLSKSITVYPNPSAGIVYLNSIDPNVRISNVRVMNLLGMEVYHADTDAGKLTIDLGDQPKGVYLITISSQYETITRRIILE